MRAGAIDGQRKLQMCVGLIFVLDLTPRQIESKDYKCVLARLMDSTSQGRLYWINLSTTSAVVLRGPVRVTPHEYSYCRAKPEYPEKTAMLGQLGQHYCATNIPIRMSHIINRSGAIDQLTGAFCSYCCISERMERSNCVLATMLYTPGRIITSYK